MGNDHNPFVNYFKLEKEVVFDKAITKGVRPVKGRLKQSGQRDPLPHINHETLETFRKSAFKLNVESLLSNASNSRVLINSEALKKYAGTLTDNRTMAEWDKYPYCCVGLLQVQFESRKIRGTAFLIGPNALLTCAHNLYCREDGTSATKVSFTLELKEQVQIVREGGKELRQRVNSGKSYEILTWRVPEEYMDPDNEDYPLFDFALLKLKTLSDLETRYGYFGLDSTWHTALVAGFPLATKQHPQNCKLLVEGRGEWTRVDSESERPENAQLMEVSYNVYTSPGQSGSPIFYEAKGEVYMVGIHTSGGEEENRGVLVTSRVREMVNGWIEEMKTIFDISNVEIGNKGLKDLTEALRIAAGSITELHLSNNSLGPEGIRQLMGMKWTQLKFLSLENNVLKLEGAQSLASPTNGWSCLEVLNINNTMVGDEGCSLLLQNREWRKLRELHLRQCSIGKATIAELSKREWGSLELMNLSLDNLSSKEISALFEQGKRFPSLRFLNLSKNNIGNEGVRTLAANECKLQTLNISKIGMNHLGMEELGSVCWSKLKKLYLSDNKDIGKQGIVFLTPARFPLLATLTLDGINLGPQGLKELMTHQWKNLKSLSIGYNFLRDQGLLELHNSGSMEILVLEGNNITTAGAVEFARRAEWAGLLQLKLGSNQIKKEGHVELINRLTKLYYISINSGLNAHDKRELKELARQRNPNLSLDIERGEEANFN